MVGGFVVMRYLITIFGEETLQSILSTTSNTYMRTKYFEIRYYLPSYVLIIHQKNKNVTSTGVLKLETPVEVTFLFFW